MTMLSLFPLLLNPAMHVPDDRPAEGWLERRLRPLADFDFAFELLGIFAQIWLLGVSVYMALVQFDENRDFIMLVGKLVLAGIVF